MLMKGCWKAFMSLAPKEQLFAANELCRSNLEAAVNPSAYFQKIVNKAMYSMPREGSSPTSPTLNRTKLPQVTFPADLPARAQSNRHISLQACTAAGLQSE